MMTNPNPPSAEETLKKLLGDYIREDFRRSTMMMNPNPEAHKPRICSRRAFPWLDEIPSDGGLWVGEQSPDPKKNRSWYNPTTNRAYLWSDRNQKWEEIWHGYVVKEVGPYRYEWTPLAANYGLSPAWWSCGVDIAEPNTEKTTLTVGSAAITASEARARQLLRDGIEASNSPFENTISDWANKAWRFLEGMQ